MRIGTLEDFDVLIKPYEKTIKPAERAILLLVWCVTVRACTCAQATQSASARQKACDCVHCDRAADKFEYIPAVDSSSSFDLYNTVRQFSCAVDKVCSSECGFWDIVKKFPAILGDWKTIKCKHQKRFYYGSPKHPGKVQGEDFKRHLINVRVLRPGEHSCDRHIVLARLAYAAKCATEKGGELILSRSPVERVGLPGAEENRWVSERTPKQRAQDLLEYIEAQQLSWQPH